MIVEKSIEEREKELSVYRETVEKALQSIEQRRHSTLSPILTLSRTLSLRVHECII